MSKSKIIIATGKIGDKTEISIRQSYANRDGSGDLGAVVTLENSSDPSKTTEFIEPINRPALNGDKDQPCSGLAFQAATMLAIKFCDENYPKLVKIWERVKADKKTFPIF